MRKIVMIACLHLLSVGVLQSQERGLYLSMGGSLGANSYNYELDNGNRSYPKLGFGGVLGVQYYFTRHWGVGTGIGITYYHSGGHYSNNWQEDVSHYSFTDMYDDDALHPELQNYTLRLGLNEWTEIQQGYFLEIPLMLHYQTKWGKSEGWGMYLGLGAKIQIPVISQEYEVKDGSELSVNGYIYGKEFPYPDPNGPDLSRHGFGKTDEPGFTGEMNIKPGVALSGELGFLRTLSRRVDLTLGAYIDYGLTNIKDGDKSGNGYLISPAGEQQTIHPSNYVGDKLDYNGYINSHAVDKANLFAVGGKIGIRVKIGKLSEKEEAQDTTVVIPEKPREKDTIYVIHQYPPIDTNLYRPQVQVQAVGEVKRDQPMEDELRILMEPIFFDLDKDNLLPASILTLNRKASILDRYPKMQLLITGNTCDLAPDSYNIKLGERRAKAAQKYLEDLGINRGRLSIVSQSFHHPLKPNIDETNREKNRRCDFYPTGY